MFVQQFVRHVSLREGQQMLSIILFSILCGCSPLDSNLSVRSIANSDRADVDAVSIRQEGASEENNTVARGNSTAAVFASIVGGAEVAIGAVPIEASAKPFAGPSLPSGIIVAPVRNADLINSAISGTGSNSVVETIAAANANKEAVSVPIPPAVSISSTSNLMAVTTSASGGTSAAPVQFARVFKRGEIMQSPVVKSNGQSLNQQQVTVKSRWPDGSVKHAIFGLVLPWGGQFELSFSDGSIGTSQQPPLTSQRIKELVGSFDLQADFKSSATMVSIKLSDLINAGALERIWVDGPHMIQFVLTDHSTARRFDFGFDSNRSLRPIFHVTVWPNLKSVKVRLIVENSNPEVLQDVTYAVDVFTPGQNATSLLRETNVTHSLGARWTREFHNIAPTPISINHNLAYLKQTGAFANYDTAIKISPAAVTEWTNSWRAAPKSLFAQGNWVKYMPTTGGRHDIGLMPTWTLLGLYTGDAALAQMSYGNAELAASWPMHFRESKSNLLFDRKNSVPSLGRPISLDARPSVYLTAGNAFINYDYTAAPDKLKVVGVNAGGNGWYPDVAHQPDPFSAVYILTGDFWLLEQLWFWTSWNSFQSAIGGANRFDSRGPLATSAGIVDQTRGDAWGIRTRTITAFLSPDDSPEKAYFTRIAEEAFTMWEGTRNISGQNNKSPEYVWGQQIGSQRYKVYATQSAVPVNHWDFGNDRAVVSSGYDPTVVKAAVSPWQQHFLIVCIGRAGELGFNVSSLLKWNAQYFESTFNNGGVAPWLLGVYTVPQVDARTSTYFPNWQATIAAMGTEAQTAESYFKRTVPNIDSGYAQFASAASAYLNPFYNSASPENFFRDNVRSVSDHSGNPKWRILPR